MEACDIEHCCTALRAWYDVAFSMKLAMASGGSNGSSQAAAGGFQPG
jgi:hypothetical protein